MTFNPAYSRKAWLPLEPVIISEPMKRTLKDYFAVMKQFDVLTNPRYMAENGQTFCNIFVWDCTSALKCEIPHWYNDAGETVPVGKGHEMTANHMSVWLESYGPAHGWQQCSRSEALVWSSQAFPTVVVYRNPHGVGHVAMVVADGPHLNVCQAGAHNMWNAPLERAVGKLPVSFYVHQ